MPFRGSSFSGRSSSFSSSCCRSYSTYSSRTYTRPLVVNNYHYHSGGYGYHSDGGFGSAFFGSFAGSWLGNMLGQRQGYVAGTTSTVGPSDQVAMPDDGSNELATAFYILGFIALCVIVMLGLFKFAIWLFDTD